MADEAFHLSIKAGAHIPVNSSESRRSHIPNMLVAFPVASVALPFIIFGATDFHQYVSRHFAFPLGECTAIAMSGAGIIALVGYAALIVASYRVTPPSMRLFAAVILFIFSTLAKMSLQSLWTWNPSMLGMFGVVLLVSFYWIVSLALLLCASIGCIARKEQFGSLAISATAILLLIVICKQTSFTLLGLAFRLWHDVGVSNIESFPKTVSSLPYRSFTISNDPVSNSLEPGEQQRLCKQYPFLQWAHGNDRITVINNPGWTGVYWDRRDSPCGFRVYSGKTIPPFMHAPAHYYIINENILLLQDPGKYGLPEAHLTDSSP